MLVVAHPHGTRVLTLLWAHVAVLIGDMIIQRKSNINVILCDK